MIQSVDRAIAILLELQGARRLRLTELAARLSLPNSTVHGIVATLAARGMVEQDSSGRYALGPGVLRLSNVYLDSNELRLRALTWTDALAERTGCAVRVGVALDGEVVVIHHVLRPDGSHQMREVGIDIPAHGTALGKAILAFDPRREANLLDGSPLPKLTGRTIVDPEALAAQLAEVREGGLAAAVDEAILGESEVAAPIFDAEEAVVGAVGVVIASAEEAEDRAIGDEVRRTAVNISRELGAIAWPPRGSQDRLA
ncbi:MAG: IclR family transcriptional regulator [Nitriliruptoraceae bacterium]